VLIASREGVEGFFDDAGLPELRLGGLDDAAAESLLEAHGRRLAPAVREQLREQTGGNPPALVELPVLLGTDELGGRSLLPTPLPLTGPGQLHPWAPGHLRELPHFSGPPFASPSLIVPAYFRGDFAQDLNPKLAATLSAQQRPTDFSIFVTPSGPVAWHSLPSWYAVSGADRMIDPALQRAMAQRIGATTGEEPRPLPRVTRSLTLKIRWKDQEGSPNRKGVGIENAYGRPDNRQTMDHSDFRILGLAASLRQASFHRGIVRAAHEVAPEWMSCDSFDLGSIPYFNQDLEDRGIPEPVRELREKVRTYDAVLIATPEYDYAIPGVLASALDWCLRSRHDPTPFRHKPVGIAGASPGGAGTARGQMVLRQILLHPPAYVMPEPQMLIPFSREKFDGQTGDLVDNETRRKLRRFLTALVAWTRRVEEPKQADRRRDLGGRMA
jgi:chromate reductase, NAD(P)H dehydrogenase (quinone)